MATTPAPRLTVSRVASGRSLDVTLHDGAERVGTYRLRLEAGHGDQGVPTVVSLVADLIERQDRRHSAHARYGS